MKKRMICLGCFAFALVIPSYGHGSVDNPRSRVLRIYEDGLQSSGTPHIAIQQALAAAGRTQYYTWNQVSQNVPNYQNLTDYSATFGDGKLASANIASFTGMDLASADWNWPATEITPGPFTINWRATAPHDPSLFRIWITKTGYNPATALKWSDLELIDQLDPGEFQKVGNDYRLPVTIPQRSGRHVLYVAWQRIDPVGEVFFSTSDVVFNVVDPNADPVISVSNVTVLEDVGEASMVVSLNKPVAAGETVTATYATTPSTATAADFTATNGTVTFEAGESSQTISIPITNDSDEESDEVFLFELSNLSGADAGVLSAEVTIEDDDSETVVEGDFGWENLDAWSVGYRGNLIITNNTEEAWVGETLTLTLPDGHVITFGFTNPSTISLAPGATYTKEMGFSMPNGSAPSGPVTAIVGDGLNSDGSTAGGEITFTATGGSVIEGDSGTKDLVFRLTLSRPVGAAETVSIGYMAHGHGASMGSDFVMTTGTHVFPEGASSATVAVPVVGDTIDERHEYFNLHFMNPTGLIMRTAEATGQIIDNEMKGSFGKQRVIAYIDATGGTLRLPPADRVTHIMYAFANLNANGTLNLPPATPGHLQQLVALRGQNPDLKILLSVGGWVWSTEFSGVAANETLREAFGQSCADVVETYALDGIDLDWEWPGVPGGPGTVPTAADGANFTLLVQEVREALDALGLAQNPPRNYELSAFTAASPAGIAALELPALATLFDFVNAQGYDLHGPWSGRTGHNAGLFDNSGDPDDDRLNIDSILSQYRAGGFRREQLTVGAPFYARGFENVGNTANGLFQTASNQGDSVRYRDLTAALESTPRYWDALAKVAYLYDDRAKRWTSLDDPQALFEKAKYSRNQGYGGVFFWDLGGDTDEGHLLITVSDGLAKVDADEDGLDDEWEQAIFGNLTTANATSDSDKDGYSDFEEAAFRTAPNRAHDFPRINLSAETMTFQSQIGVTYQLESSDSLTSPSWTTMEGAMEGTGGVIDLSTILNSSTGPFRFFRLSVDQE